MKTFKSILISALFLSITISPVCMGVFARMNGMKIFSRLRSSTGGFLDFSKNRLQSLPRFAQKHPFLTTGVVAKSIVTKGLLLGYLYRKNKEKNQKELEL